MLNFLIKIKPREEEKPIGRHIEKKGKTFGIGKNLTYARKDRIYLGSGFPVGALISATTSLLGLALFKKIF